MSEGEREAGHAWLISLMVSSPLVLVLDASSRTSLRSCPHTPSLHPPFVALHQSLYSLLAFSFLPPSAFISRRVDLPLSIFLAQAERKGNSNGRHRIIVDLLTR